MRNINDFKFRGYDTEYEKMTYFDDEDYLLSYGQILRSKIEWNYDYDEERIGYEDVNNKIILMQYTGLHDKNGKEIYEGDAWEDEDGYYIIVWDEKEAGFLVDTYGFEEWLGEGGQECYGNKIEFISREPIDYFDFSKIEITKNIYDNPDLLEKGAEE